MKRGLSDLIEDTVATEQVVVAASANNLPTNWKTPIGKKSFARGFVNDGSPFDGKVFDGKAA